MRCRLTRCTYTPQNPAIAPQTACGLLTYTVLKAFASRNPCLCRGAPMCASRSNASRHTVMTVIYRKNHLKRRSFLVASSSPPWLNLYFCCYATKIKEKDHVRSADIHGSKSVGFHHGCTRIFKSPVGDAPCGVPRVGVYSLTPYVMAITLRTNPL